MNIPLVVCRTDYRWQLLANILKIFDSRKSKMVAAYRPVNPAIAVIKIVLTSMFFSTTISHVVEELRQRKELREFLRINEVPKEDYIYSFLSRLELNEFTAMVLRILNSITKRRARNTRIIVDCTDVSVDINYFRKPVRQRDLEGKDFRWGYSPKGMFLGMKLTLVLEHSSLKPLFLLHPANKHEAKIFQEVFDELKKRKIIRRGDTVWIGDFTLTGII